MSYWAQPETDRDQIVLIPTTLSDRIPQDHAVRLFWELLETYDWRPWETQYCGCVGQPAIHPRIMAGVLLYGLTQGIRSSRKLEWACTHAVDFLWLAGGRSIDHSTFCEFRTRFGRELKDLFRHLGRLALTMGVVRLNCVALDGTKTQACSSRHATRTAAALEAELARLDERLAALLADAEAVDRQETQSLFGEDRAPLTRLSKELASTQARQRRLQKALAQLQRRQAAGSHQTAVAVSDPEAPIRPNKTGGFAPNYTPVIAADAQRRYIVAQTVQGDAPEAAALLPLLAQTQQTLGALPAQVVADSGFSTPENLAALEPQPLDAYLAPANERLEGEAPTPRAETQGAQRDDVRQPLAGEQWAALPRTAGGQLAKTCFLYEEATDTYWCPLGRSLPFHYAHTERKRGRPVVRRFYRCVGCVDCPLRAECTGGVGTRTLRSLGRDPRRERMAAKVHSPAGRVIYRQRKVTAEPPFAVIKGLQNVRQFLLRGLEKVRTEWSWISTAYNLRILMQWVRRQWHRRGVALA
jgi:transposase